MNEENDDISMQVYEVGYLLIPSIPEEKLAIEMSNIKSAIEAHGAVFISEDFPKMKALNYAIQKVTESKRQKFNQAYFGWVKFEMPSPAITAAKKDLDKMQTILRFLIIKTVRENTLVSGRIAPVKKTEKITGTKGVMKGRNSQTPTISTEEIDKSIDALILN